MDKVNSEIVKLTERISKDPKSKLFVPLAEEYKKAGDIEMAIHVLSDGLKNNPTYVTARSVLGRLLYESGDLVGAQKEFEEVVKAIPDNLLAQRKLGELYSLQFNHIEALKHYKIALALNPGDKFFAALVSKLEESIGTKTNPEREMEPVSPVLGTAEGPEWSETPVNSMNTASALQAFAVIAEEQQLSKDVPPLKPESLIRSLESGEEKTSEIIKSAETSVGQEQASESAYQELPLSPIPENKNLLAETEQTPVSFAAPPEMEVPEEVLSVEPIEEVGPFEAPFFAGEPSPRESVPENLTWDRETSETDISIFDHELPEEKLGLFGVQESAIPVASETVVQPFEIVAATSPETVLLEKPAADESDDFTTDTLAELYIAQGFFEKAIDIYERMMADRPENLGLKEKLERVRAMASVNPPEQYASEVMESLESLEEKIEPGIFEKPNEFIIMQEETEKPEESPAAETPVEILESKVLIGEKESSPLEAVEKNSLPLSLETERQAEPEESVLAPLIKSESKTASIFDDAKEYKLGAETEEFSQAVAEMPASGIVASSRDRKSVKTNEASVDFEPREYIPSDGLPREASEGKVRLTPLQSITARKETIDRLENWLKNIKKER